MVLTDYLNHKLLTSVYSLCALNISRHIRQLNEMSIINNDR